MTMCKEPVYQSLEAIAGKASHEFPSCPGGSLCAKPGGADKLAAGALRATSAFMTWMSWGRGQSNNNLCLSVPSDSARLLCSLVCAWCVLF